MAQHLIFSRAANDKALAINEVVQRAPAVFSQTKAERLSNRYAPLHTSDIIPIMADYGYEVTQAAQRRTRKNSLEHAAHLIAFSKSGDITTNDDIRPEIVLYNSHDGTSSVNLFAGAYRFICSNGIVAGDGFNAKVRHTTGAMNGFEDMLRSTIDNMPNLMDTIEGLRSRQLNADERYELARRAVLTRWDMLDTNISDATPKGAYAFDVTVRQALGAQRIQDESNDAWTVFNRIQENVLRGNLFIRSITNTNGYVHVKERKSRPITNVKEHVRVNRELFDLVTA